MGILNKRNAILGWAVWQSAKVMAKRKAKRAMPAVDGEGKGRSRKAMLLGALAAFGGALLFWRKRGGAAPEQDEPVG